MRFAAVIGVALLVVIGYILFMNLPNPLPNAGIVSVTPQGEGYLVKGVFTNSARRVVKIVAFDGKPALWLFREANGTRQFIKTPETWSERLSLRPGETLPFEFEAPDRGKIGFHLLYNMKMPLQERIRTLVQNGRFTTEPNFSRTLQFFVSPPEEELEASQPAPQN